VQTENWNRNKKGETVARHLNFNGLHRVISHKTDFFIKNAVRTPDHTKVYLTNEMSRTVILFTTVCRLQNLMSIDVKKKGKAIPATNRGGP
jgi:hypothetical protein